jgi:Protein of unknown function DUF2625
MGALALETGGLLIGGGWLRILGGGGPNVRGDLASWNGLGAVPLLPPHDRFMIVAHDVLGGFFALDGGWLGDGRGGIFYFAPDALSWEELGLGYSAFVQAMLGDALTHFYADSRWVGWEQEVAPVAPDKGLSFAPPCGRRRASRSREPTVVPSQCSNSGGSSKTSLASSRGHQSRDPNADAAR